MESEHHLPDYVDYVAQRGISRRKFLQFCGLMAATLAMPMEHASRIAAALAHCDSSARDLARFQDCTGDSESFLREPTLTSLVLDTLSIDYHETLMAPAGRLADKSRTDTLQKYKGQYICIVEGSIPTGNNGVYTLIGGQTALAIAQQVCRNALATIAVGTCAWDGGLSAAAPNPTGALGVKDAVPGLGTLVNLPGCPVNVYNLTATIVHYLTYNQWPATDGQGRPLFAYDEEIHDECERHDHYEEGRFVLAWGDEGHKKGWCLYKMGCKGPATHSNCPSVKWNDGTNWPIGAGHGCIGCTTSKFWDRMTPFYRALPDD